jgi:hypothetical protein
VFPNPTEKAKSANNLKLAFRDTDELVGMGKSAGQWTDEHLDFYLNSTSPLVFRSGRCPKYTVS